MILHFFIGDHFQALFRCLLRRICRYRTTSLRKEPKIVVFTTANRIDIHCGQMLYCSFCGTEATRFCDKYFCTVHQCRHILNEAQNMYMLTLRIFADSRCRSFSLSPQTRAM